MRNYRFINPILKHRKQYRRMITHRASESQSLYTVSAVNGLSCLTTTSNEQAGPIQKFLNRTVTFESNRNGWFESNRISKLCRSLSHRAWYLLLPQVLAAAVSLLDSSIIHYSKCLFPRRSGETIQKLAIPLTANERMFHITTSPIAVDIVWS